jgi:MerR family transcriptional regulator, redox-sensitive transcriptional activator SoxR
MLVVQPQPKLRSSYDGKQKAVHASDIITIGDLSARTGVSISALRFYEARGMITPHRSQGGQRRYLRADIRRVSFIRIAQNVGLSVEAIGAHLRTLPNGRTPNARDWAKISANLRATLDGQIATLTNMRDKLDHCIGCGCLSLKVCALYNPDDRIATKGSGPRFVLDE